MNNKAVINMSNIWGVPFRELGGAKSETVPFP